MALRLETAPVVTGGESDPRLSATPRTAGLPLWAWLVAAVLILTHACLAWQSRTAGVTHSNDDALYMLLGRELGNLSYRENFRVGAPMHGQYPPAWPALIALSNLVTGGSEQAAFALAMLLSTLGLLAFFDTARRLLPAWLALGVLSVVAINPSLVSFAGRVMSEAAFWFWTSITFWALIRGREDRRFLVLAGIAAIISAFTRSIGVTLIGAVGVSFLLDRAWRALIIYSGAALVLLGGWGAFTAVNHEKVVGRSYVADAASQFQPASGEESIAIAFAKKVANRIREQLMGTVPAIMPFVRVNGTVVDNVLWLAVTVVLGLMGLVALRDRLPAMGLYLLFYLGLIAIWPWGPRRFFIPVQPFVLLTLILGAYWVLGRRLPRLASAMCISLLAAISAAAFPTLAANHELMQTCDRSTPWTDGRCYDPDQRSFFAAVTFARDSLPGDARFLVEREAAFAYHTRRVVQHDQIAIGMPDSTFRDYLHEKKIDYVVVTRLTNVELEGLAPKLLANCTYFDVLRRFPPYGRLYQFHAERVPAGQDACSDLNYYVQSTPKRAWAR